MHLAVYGTLKRGFHNHSLMDPRGFSFVGSFVSANKYHMTSNGGFPIVYKNQQLHYIEAEIFEIRDKAYLSQIDRLEGHPTWYERELINFQNDMQAWMYLMDEPRYVPKYYNVRINNGVASWVRTHD